MMIKLIAINLYIYVYAFLYTCILDNLFKRTEVGILNVIAAGANNLDELNRWVFYFILILN